MIESPWIPLGDRIVAVRHDHKLSSGLVLPDVAKPDPLKTRYEVVAVGAGAKEIKVGDHVVFVPNAPTMTWQDKHEKDAPHYTVTSEEFCALVWKDSRGMPAVEHQEAVNFLLRRKNEPEGQP